MSNGFSAYPQQQGWGGWCSQPQRWRLALSTAVLGVTFLALMGGLENSSSRPISTEQLKDMQVRQPFLASTGFEVGIWTRKRAEKAEHAEKESAEASKQDLPSQPQARRSRPAAEETEEPAFESEAKADEDGKSERPETRHGPSEEGQHEQAVAAMREADELRQQLEAERVRAAAQEAELARLRASVAAAAVRSSAEEAVAAAVDDESPAVAKESIPVSLWREPPGSESASDEAATTAASNVTTASSSDEAAQEPSLSVQQGRRDEKQQRITIRTGGKDGGDIVVSIGGHAGDDEKPVASEGPPAEASPSNKANAELGKEASSPSATADVMDTQAAPQSVEQDPGDEQETSTTAQPPEAKAAPTAERSRSENSSPRITVSTGSGEIIVQINNEKKEDPAEKRTEEAASAQTEPLTTTTPTSLRGAPPAASAPAVLQTTPASTTTAAARPQEPVATTSTPVRIADTGKAAEDEPAKPSKSTSITVKSAGQSITIEVHGDDSTEAVAQTTTVATAAAAAATSTSEIGAAAAPTTTKAARSTPESLQPVPEEPPRPLAPLIPRPLDDGAAADGEHSAPDDAGETLADALGTASDADAARETLAEAEGSTVKADSFANLAMRAR